MRPFEAMLYLFRNANLRRLYDPLALLSAVPVSLVILVGGVLSLRSHSVLRQDRDLVIHTYDVIGTSTRVLLSAGDAETGQRGFIITGDSTFLEPYRRASRTTIPTELQTLGRLVGDNPSQLQRVARLKKLLERKFEELSETIQSYQEAGFESARLVISRKTGKNVMDDIRRETRQIEIAEKHLLAARSREVQKDERQIIIIAIGTTLFSTLLRIGIAMGRQRLLRYSGHAT